MISESGGHRIHTGAISVPLQPIFTAAKRLTAYGLRLSANGSRPTANGLPPGRSGLFMWTLPSKVAPSAIRIRGAVMLPSTVADVSS